MHVDKIEKHIGNGCTEPFLAILNDGNNQINAVIKTKNNIQGVLSLVNEFIAYHLAINIGILMPKSGVAIIDTNTKVDEKFITTADYGFCFYSTYLERSALLNENIMKYILNKNAYEEIILFEHLVYNKDRNRGNLLIAIGKGNKVLYAIDHTHVFKNATLWDSICFKQGMESDDYMDNDILVANGYELFFRDKKIDKGGLKVVAHKFSEVVTPQLLDRIIEDIPTEWEVLERDLEALKRYILYRLGHINEICEMIAEYKEWR